MLLISEINLKDNERGGTSRTEIHSMLCPIMSKWGSRDSLQSLMSFEMAIQHPTETSREKAKNYHSNS